MNISLKKIDKTNFEAVVDLDVHESQKRFVAPNMYSIAEASVYESMHAYAIYDNDTPVGFTMYGRSDEDDKLWIVRLMVDASHQRKGYGTKALGLLLDKMHDEYGREDVYLSTSPDNETVIAFYERHGFRKTGAMVDDELVMCRFYYC